MSSGSVKKRSLQVQHVFVALGLTAVFFYIVFYMAVPYAMASFVVPLFAPPPEQQARTPFIKFDGLVWGTTSLEKGGEAKGKVVSKDYIQKEFIFDFTWKARNEEEHGYTKAANEFYARAPVLGENAIYIEPYVGFLLVAFVISLAFMMVVTMFFPTSIGLMSLLFDRQIEDTKIKLRLQTGFADHIIELLIMPDDKLKDKDISEVRSPFRLVWDRTFTEDIASPMQAMRFEDVFRIDSPEDLVKFRNDFLYNRIREFFSEFVEKEIKDIKEALLWRRNKVLISKGFKLYMSHHFTEKYSNVVTGMAYGGAAFLIVAVGIRGLKFIPATRPSFILLAIGLEFTLLALMALTLIYTEEEERMDKMLKKMEDANRSQLEALRSQQADIHQLANALVGQTASIIQARVEKAIEEFMTNADNVEKIIGQQIAEKILISIKENKQR